MKSNGRSTRKSLELDKVQAADAEAVIGKIIGDKAGIRGLDLSPIHKFAAHLKELAGKSLKEFLELRDDVREELHNAAALVHRKFRAKAESLHGFLQHIAGILKQAVDTIAEHGGQVAVFLLAIRDPESAKKVRAHLLHG